MWHTNPLAVFKPALVFLIYKDINDPGGRERPTRTVLNFTPPVMIATTLTPNGASSMQGVAIGMKRGLGCIICV